MTPPPRIDTCGDASMLILRVLCQVESQVSAYTHGLGCNESGREETYGLRGNDVLRGGGAVA